MIAAFIISASLVLILSICCLILQTREGETSNPFNRVFYDKVRRPIRKLIGAQRAERYAVSLFAMVMMISDQQLVTGIAILSAAIGAMRTRSITVYHFNIVTDMGWLSSNTHIMTLMVMRMFIEAKQNGTRYQEEHKALNTIPLTIRVISMIVLAVLLLYATEVSSYADWNEKLNCPATCVQLGKKGGMPLKQMIISYVFIIQGYTTQILLLIPAFRRFWTNRMAPWFIAKDENLKRDLKQGTLKDLMYKMVKYITLPVFFFFTSEVEFVVEMMAWYALGLYWTFTDRQAGHKRMKPDDIATENHVGFGQLVPLLLLLLAFLAFSEQYTCKYLSMKKRLNH
jgi:hypothetical protein